MRTPIIIPNTLFIAIFCLNSLVMAQSGYSSASLSMNRSIGILSSDEVVVEEYMNYHKHNILMPSKNESVAMDLRASNSFLPKNDEGTIFQIGIATGFIKDIKKIPPLNLTFVIDKSGSMASDNKLMKLKVALKELNKKLRKQDILSIIVFDDNARVLVSSVLFNSDKIDQKIDSLNADGSTNMYDGLMLGYQQAIKNFNKNKSNCVILLTDGMTNQGVVNPIKIANDSKTFNDMGIELTTIGVGNDLNFDLLHKLANQGKGSMHFIANCDDIQKVFIDEVESLLKPIAKNIKLQIEFPNSIVLEAFYGYSPLIVNGRISVELNNFGSGLTQIFMMKFKQNHNFKGTENAMIKVTLSYFDLNDKKDIAISKQIELNFQNRNEDADIKKNYAITILAQSLKDMAYWYEKHPVKAEAKLILEDAIFKVEKIYPVVNDKDILRVLNITKGYVEALA